MLTFLHPLLAWGLAAVAVPILIHLLLRQKPKPRPWAAMRWLLAAHKEASRRWKLTNWLLLLLRCLVVVLLALAVARPELPGIGGGAHLVVVVDRSASMGARSGDAGPLAQAQARLAESSLPYARWTVVAAGSGSAEVLADGSRSAAIEAIGRLAAVPLPGGLDDAARGPAGDVVGGAVEPGCDVLLISDFQQDDGGRLAALCTGRARRVARWAVGHPALNRWWDGPLDAGDPRPGEGGELKARIGGPPSGVRLGVDGATAVRVAGKAGGELRLPLPPLPAGDHRLRLELEDGGLAYDDVIEIPLRIRPPLGALVVAERTDYASAALLAEDAALQAQRIRPGAFAGTALPPGGALLLRSPVADAPRIAAWVRAGGVLWAPLDQILGDPALAGLAPGLERRSGDVPGGAWHCGDPAIDEILGLAARPRIRAAVLPTTAQVLLTAGSAPAVAAVPAGRGWLVAELDELAGDQDLAARPTAPLWVVQTVRRLAASADAPATWVAGTPAPQAARLVRGGAQVALAAGAPVLAAPGTWTSEGRPVVILPSPEEARTTSVVPAGAFAELDQALPVRPGRDLGLWLLLAAALAAAAEMALAAWAGRTYGG